LGYFGSNLTIIIFNAYRLQEKSEPIVLVTDNFEELKSKWSIGMWTKLCSYKSVLW